MNKLTLTSQQQMEKNVDGQAKHCVPYGLNI